MYFGASLLTVCFILGPGTVEGSNTYNQKQIPKERVAGHSLTSIPFVDERPCPRKWTNARISRFGAGWSHWLAAGAALEIQVKQSIEIARSCALVA